MSESEEGDTADDFTGDCDNPLTFRCPDGQCIPEKQRCDGVMFDCMNNEDEQNCGMNCSIELYIPKHVQGGPNTCTFGVSDNNRNYLITLYVV